MSAGITKMGSLAEEKEKKPVKSRRKDTMNALFKTPLVRQYLHKGIMYREAEPRDPSRFELFFDLLYVGIIRQFAHIPEYNYNGTNLAVFIVLFFGAWSIWQETRNFINIAGTDDFVQRLHILLIMILLVGYTVELSSVGFDAV